MSCNAKKDPNGTWRIQYRWTDWTGTKKKSQKRGFKTKKEAEEWYAHFMLQQSSDPTMTLADFWEIYKAAAPRIILHLSTRILSRSIINCLTRHWTNTMQSRNARTGRLKAIMKRYPGVSRKNYFMR